MTTRHIFSLLAAALVAAACSDAATPLGEPRHTTAAGTGITLDQQTAVLNDGEPWPGGGTHVGKDFPTNPHPGDAIVATFLWHGSSNTITSVADHLCDANNTPVGNTYTLVDYVTAGGTSMATYVATNVRGFADTSTASGQTLCVHAIFSDAITEGGVILSAYSGVGSTAALGAHQARAGSGSTTTVADPGAIAVPAGALAYGVSMVDGAVGKDPPPGFTNITDVSDAAVRADAEYAVPTAGGNVDPQWTWYFQSPHTWLASALALNPASGSTNQPPTAAFTSSCTNLACAFTNSSSDPDGTIASNSWNFGDGATSTAQSPSHSYAAAGTYTVTLTVTDNQGATNTVSHNVTVTGPNQPPTANFTFSCSALSCTFTSTSSDPDGSIASYSWTFGDGTTSTAQNPSHSYASGGTYTVTLTVTDNQGATNAVSHNVTVSAANQSPTAAFTSSCNNLACAFTNSSSDPDGTIASNSWDFGDGTTSTAQSPSHSYGAAGTYTVTLTVTDNQGATNSVSHTVTVTVPNQPPVAAFTSSCSNLSCSFTSTSSDPDGTITAYSWSFGDGATAITQNPSYTYAAAGTYTVTLTVTDNQGATSSVSQSITVSGPNQAPVVNAGPDQTVVLGLLYSLNASFGDPDNGPWTWRINWGDGSTSTGSASSPGTISASHSYLGFLTTRTITVTVTDKLGASGSDTKLITLIL